ncbi:MAG: efflux RND transporter permease subunit, partial [Francisellaceae bacterium]
GRYFAMKKRKLFCARSLWRYSVLMIAVMLIVITVIFVASGFIRFTFFPSPEGKNIKLNVSFYAGTPKNQVVAFTDYAKQTLMEIASQQQKIHPNDPPMVETITTVFGQTYDLQRDHSMITGDTAAHINVELSSPDLRHLSNESLSALWKRRIGNYKNVETLAIAQPTEGPPGRDIDIRLSGNNAHDLKQAANEIKEELAGFAGVENIADNLPIGAEEWVYQLKPAAIAKGLSAQSLVSQVNAAISGTKIQSYTEGQDEIDLKIRLDDDSSKTLKHIPIIPIKMPDGHIALFDDVASARVIQGFDTLRHEALAMSINISATINASLGNANQIIASLQKTLIPALERKYGIKADFSGKAEEQTASFADMKLGITIGIILIYLILAFVFSSFTWPLMVMIMIPMGLIGAIIGHVILGYDLTILSLFGLFGLSGIVVNDSIILIDFYKEKLAQNNTPLTAIMAAVKARFRPIFLTSVTTMAGLTPLLFETSMQAQFLIPLAISIVFGIAFASLTILFLLPSMLAISARVKDQDINEP